MEWVETTGKTVEEATESLLDELGVDAADADIEILEEPKAGLFGRTRGAARVRARIRPTAPPPKQDRRRVRRKGGSSKGGDDSSAGRGSSSTAATSDETAAQGGGDEGRRGSGRRQDGGNSRSGDSGAQKVDKKVDRDMMPEDEQRAAGEEFLNGLVAAFGVDATVTSDLDDEGILRFEVAGEQLGLLIGPGLGTLEALQEVCRNAIQRQAAGREYGKVLLDVAGARAERTAALEEFVRAEAQRVLDDGGEIVFEPMSRGDRKIVHDVIGEFDGLATESVGEDPRRRVMLRPA